MDERLARIGRLAATARGLEREGAYNGAKLLRAAMQSELIRYAEAEAPSGARQAADAVDLLVAELGSDLPAGLASLLGGIAETVRSGGTVALGDAPRVRVCRTCGAVFLGDNVPASCAACEAPVLSFHEELPVWYLEPADRGAILAALAAGSRHIGDAVAGRDDASLAMQPAPGEWSARQTLEHLLFTEELFSLRIGRLLSEDRPDLAAAAVWNRTSTSDEGSVATTDPASVLAARVRELRAANVNHLASLPDESWGRAGDHPEWGRVTVLSQAAYFARHESAHMAQLVAAADGRLPGSREAR